TYITGAPATPSPQAMGESMEMQAGKQAEFIFEETAPEADAATQRPTKNNLTENTRATVDEPKASPTQETPAQQWQAKHHIATNKNTISAASGGPWTPRFEPFFKNAGLDMNKGAENLVEVINHAGPHPEAYHQLVFDRLTAATIGLPTNSSIYTAAVSQTLQAIGKEAQTIGSQVNILLTKP
ncbi:MAG TPA: AHH domain-containing protein, partial [Mucilaginibacter sp.]